MKKRLIGSILMTLVLGVSSLSCFAASESHVTLNSKSELIYEESEVSVSVAPGETFTEKIVIKNEYEKTADFYMNTQVLKDLEESVGEGKAKGAGYEVKLSIINGDATTVLYDSSVGGEGTENGLSNVDLSDTMLIATLETGKTASVVMEIFFDGEGLDNTKTADYSNAVANLSFEFKAGYEEPTGDKVSYKTVTEQREDVIVDVVTEAPQTGDSIAIPVAIVVLLLAGVSLILAGKKNKSNKASVLIGAFAIILIGAGSKSFAGEATYTVTFRPGVVGEFVTTASDYNENNTPGFVSATQTELGAIKVTVTAGSAMPSFPNVKASEGYVENTSWKDDATETVTRDADYVADYAKLIAGVEYTIEFVDSVTGDSVYPTYITLGNVGDTVTATVPAEIVLSESAFYYPVSGQKATMTLTDNKEKNVLTIRYNMQERTTTERVIVNYIDGNVITRFVPATAPAAAVNPGGGAVVAPVVNPIENENEPENEEVVIEENDVPLANGPTESDDNGTGDNKGSDEGDVIDITEPEIPLAPSVETSKNWPYLVGAALVLAAVAACAVVANKKKKQSVFFEKNEGNEEDK